MAMSPTCRCPWIPVRHYRTTIGDVDDHQAAVDVLSRAGVSSRSCTESAAAA